MSGDELMWLKEVLKEIKESVRNTQADVTEIKVIQAKQHQTLEDHIRRTGTNEELIALNKAEADFRFTDMRAELAPLKAHVQRWAGAGIVLSVLATLLGIAAALMKFLG